MGDVIVVGVDGSANGWHALDWSVEEATVRGATLRIVCAFENPGSAVGLGSAFGSGMPVDIDPAVMEGAAKEVVDEAVRRCGGVSTEVVARCDRPGDVLVEASKDAALLVVGSRGHSAVGSLLLGSVSNFVAHHASCPIVIVPPGTA